ncbi:MAG: AMP-binding protein [Eubacterium sp.]|nr:AMP-binding protein [Eubacterium sp.]
MLEKLLHHKRFSLEFFRHLKILCYVLEPMPPETLIKMQSLKPDIRVYSDYGLTETAGTVAVLGPKDHMDAVKKYHMPSVGRFLPGVEVCVSDQNGREVSCGEVGELMVHAPWQLERYLGEEEHYWIATGDMGWMDREGYFYMSGFHTCLSPDKRGTLYILPAVARKHYTNIPLYSKKALLHGAVSFARKDRNSGFSSAGLTFIKQISHHLNLALLNARAFQELQMRQGRRKRWILRKRESFYRI